MMGHALQFQSLQWYLEFPGTIRLQRMKQTRHSNYSLRTKGESQVHLINPDVPEKYYRKVFDATRSSGD
jgi:hypothetical protein